MPKKEEGYKIHIVDQLQGMKCRFPYSPSEGVFRVDAQPWKLIEVEGVNLFMSVSRKTKRIAIGVLDNA